MADNLLDKASILLTPTAYNDGSMLSVKPENGDGDFTFSRGSAATRVNAQGLVENVQIISSELVLNGDFSQEGSELVTNGDFATDSNWTLASGISYNSNGYIDFDGTQGSGQARNTPNITFVAGKTYKVVYEIKNYVSGNIRFRFQTGANTTGQAQSGDGIKTEYIVCNDSANNNFQFFNSSSFIGSIDNVSVKEVGQNWTLGTGWSIDQANSKVVSDGTSSFSSLYQNTSLSIGTKCIVKFDAVVNSGGFQGIGFEPFNQIDITSSGNYEFITETRLNKFEFRTNSLFDGSITNISVKEITDDTDLPRIDYTDGCGSWLLEGQSTNLITQSEALSTMQVQATITDNNLLSPTSNVNASLVVENTTTDTHGIRKQSIIPTNASAVDYTVSVFAKKKERQFVNFQFYADSTQYNSSTFNLNDGTTTGDSSTHKIEDYGNGWYRCSFTQSITQSTGSYNFAAAYMSQSLTSYYAGDGTSGIYMFGFQTEQLSYATSYIPTNGAIATRLADVATNSGNASLINSTEGVLYAEIAALADGGSFRIISLSDGTDDNRVIFYYDVSINRLSYQVKVSGVSQMVGSINNVSVLQFNKIALKYKENDFALWINGVEVATDTVGNIFPLNTLTKLNFSSGNGTSNFYGKAKALAVFPILTDAQLQSLTTI